MRKTEEPPVQLLKVHGGLPYSGEMVKSILKGIKQVGRAEEELLLSYTAFIPYYFI